jgi:hypothetical protein
VKFQGKLPASLLHKTGILPGFSFAEAVIHMDDAEPEIQTLGGTPHEVKKDHGVDASGDADKHGIVVFHGTRACKGAHEGV